MRICIYLGHPAHFHYYKYIIAGLRAKGHEVDIIIKTKDILEDLLRRAGLSYYNILPEGRKDTRLAILSGVLKRDYRLYKLVRKKKPDVLVGGDTSFAHIGRLLNIPNFIVVEDDAHAVPQFAHITYPFARHIVASSACSLGKWEQKHIPFNGYLKYAYLHPDYFKPDINKVRFLFKNREKYFLLRFARLTAHHDKGKRGIDAELARKIISILNEHGEVYISSERELQPEFEKYRINIDVLDIHHALYFAELFLGDSQTMAAEAAILGTPSLRFSDFAGRLGYLEELEHKYGLTYGIKTDEPGKLLDKLDEILKMENAGEVWAKRREKMIADKIDVVKFMVWLIENYPDSVSVRLVKSGRSPQQ